MHKSPCKGIVAFDLDGTITRCELLPRIAAAISLEEEMAELTRVTLCGILPFEESFRRRFAMLRTVPVDVIHGIIAHIPLDDDILQFIHTHQEQCVVITGNLDIWVAPLLERIGCRYYSSTAEIRHDGLHLTSVLNKGDAIRALRGNNSEVLAHWPKGAAHRPEKVAQKREGVAHKQKERAQEAGTQRPTGEPSAVPRIIAVGESVNDIPMLREADVAIVFSGVHAPIPQVLEGAHHIARTGKELCDIVMKELA